MAMSSKILVLLVLCLFAISLAHSLVSAANDGHHHHLNKVVFCPICFCLWVVMALEVSTARNAARNARGDAGRHSTTSPACFSVKSAAGNACVFLLVTTETSPSALATITGRPSTAALNAPESDQLERWLACYPMIT
ncbi:hypothetical protein AKJ16_DCAP14075 [Drosera capensis]